MSFDWFPWYIQKFRDDTLHLTLQQDGAYRRLIDEYMARQGPLPADDCSLARICGCSLEEWLSVAEVVRKFFRQQNGKLVQKRCEQELHAQRMLAASRTAQARDAAATRWRKHNELKQLNANALPTHYASNADAMLNDATRHKSIYKNGSAPVETVDKSHNSEPAEAPQGLPRKQPSQVSRAELEAMFAAKKRAAQ